MTEKFKNKYRIPSTRFQTWDYGSNAAYFATICTKNRVHYFGEIVNMEMQLSDIGEMAQTYWEEIPKHFSFVELDEFVVMPNHVHGIVIINKSGVNENGGDDVKGNGGDFCGKPKTFGQLRFQNQGKNTISSIVGSFKSIVTKNAHLIPAIFAWQPLFHDHIIRDADSFTGIQNYIFDNPKKWKEDKFYS